MLETYTILHTNDFHNHFTNEQSISLKQRVADLGTRGLMLDAGDAISAGNVTYKPGGEPILDTMSDIGYAAMTVGNREFHFSRAGFQSKVSRARFPILCANVRTNRGPNRADPAANGNPDIDPPVVSWRVFNLEGGFRIAVFGITVPMITERMLVRKVSSYVFDDPLTTAARLVPEIVANCRPDVLVALTHIGIRFDRELALDVPGIDLIIGGHTHVDLSEGELVKDTVIAQAGSHGRLLGIIDIDTERSGHQRFHARTQPL